MAHGTIDLMVAFKESASVQDLIQWQQECVDTAPARLAEEEARLRARGIVDEKGRDVSQELPHDMEPHSTADLTTL
jgi:hypothetical protein